jgi:hypothetical protein
MNTLTKLSIAGSLALGSIAAHASINGPVSSQKLGNAVLFADVFNSAGNVVGAYAGDTGQATATLATGALTSGVPTTFSDANLQTLLGEAAGNTIMWALEAGTTVGGAQTLVSSSTSAAQLANATGGGTLQGMGSALSGQILQINGIIAGPATSLLGTIAAQNGGTFFNPTALAADLSNWGGATQNVATTGLNNSTALYTLSSTGVFDPSTTVANGLSVTLTSAGLVFSSGTSTVTPLPAAVWLLGSGLLGLAGVGRRKSKAA